MGIMIHQCHTWGTVKCAYIPHKFVMTEITNRVLSRIAHSWEWMYTDQKDPPYIIQLDCETDGGSKLMQLGKFGFHFTNRDGSCDEEKVRVRRFGIKLASIHYQCVVYCKRYYSKITIVLYSITIKYSITSHSITIKYNECQVSL